MKQMAHRPLVKWQDGSYYIESLPDERLDLSGRERFRIALGALFFGLVFLAVLLLSGGPQ